jgi:murein DD-endopeptidase MepM/ murein hydrolase activator NlpD
MHVNNSGDPHWTASGGTPIVVSQGETASILANRYGVPVEAFIKSNGLSAQSQVQPGMRVVVPVYRASAVASKAPLDTASKPLSKAEMAALHQNELKAEKERKLLEQQALKQKELDKISARREALALEKEKRLAELKVKNTKGAVSKTVADNAGQSQTTLAKSPSETAPIAAPVVAEKATKSVQKLAQSEKSASDSSKNVDKSPTASIPPDDVKSLATDDGRPEFRWPARGRIIQGYASGGNDGINIAVPEGTQVKAAEGGEVAYAGSELKGYGNMVLIRHPNGFVTAYANNGELVVKKGDKVKRGQTIAHSGQSGNVGSPQLHFELRKGSTPVDPTSYLAGL